MKEDIILPYVYGGMVLLVILFVGSILLPLLSFRSAKAKIAGIAIVLVGWGLWIDVPGKLERDRAVDWRNKGIEQCAAELESISGPFETEGLVAQGGAMTHRALVTMLGKSRLLHVELPVRSFTPERDGRTGHGVSIRNGDNLDIVPAPAGAQFVRLALAAKGHPDCVGSSGLGSSLAYPPFLPNVCLSATPINAPSASHEVVGLPISGNKRLIRWTVRDRRSGQVLAALTSSDAPDAPVHQEGSMHSKETLRIGDDLISCRKPYESLMLLARNSRTTENPLVLRDAEILIPPRYSPNSVEKDPELPTIDVVESPVLDWTKEYDRLVVNNTWSQAWSRAQQVGWSTYQGGLVDARSGKYVRLTGGQVDTRSSQVPGARVLATPNGFFWTQQGPNPYTYLAAFSLEGKLLWRAQLRTQLDHPNHILGFDPIVIHSDGETVAIYGFRYDQSTQKSVVSALRFRHDALAARVQQ